ncbi:MAG: DUF2179 domain-containing protein [Lachnospiraceae bacterium]
MEKRNEIITIVDKGEYQKLMNYMNREDPKAFITVYTVSDMRYQPKRWMKEKNRQKFTKQNVWFTRWTSAMYAQSYRE